MVREIYLDNSATTKMCEQSLKRFIFVSEKNYGNPSSLHTLGFEAENIILESKKIIAQKINANEKEIIFTSGGTESNNLAILGSIKKKSGTIISTSIEHSSVKGPLEFLSKKGYNVFFVNPYLNSFESDLEKLITDETLLVSIMLVNNETGLILPCDKIKDIIRRKNSNALLHIDAVQGFCKIPIDVKKLSCDLLSISAHKINGPKGVGALYIKNGLNVNPIIFGGNQQNKIRPGTEPVSLIAAFAEAVKQNFDYAKIESLRKYCIEKLSKIKNLKINSSLKDIAYIVNVSIPPFKSETILHYLASKKIFVSSGSACSKGKNSYVLKELGLSKEFIESAIRISFSHENEKEDIDYLSKCIECAIKELVYSKK